MSEGFNPNKSTISQSRMSTFLKEEISGDLNDIPGIGAKGIEILKSLGIENTFQLIGKFMMLKKSNMTDKEYLDAIWDWLKETKVAPGHRSGIISAIGLKLAVYFPNLVNDNCFVKTESNGEVSDEVLLKN